jgi:UDP-GlcNAc:undecaprenyl-phosphate GlcNAc-1-phosphate transferase
MTAVFAGAIIGFIPLNLPLNAPRSLGGGGAAKIFLGDTGSMFLGLMLAILTVISGGKLATVLLVFGLVIIDALYVILKRILRGKNPLTTPDQSHLHHRFLRAGFTPAMSLILITLLSLSFGLAGLLTSGKLKIILIVILALFSILLFLLLDLVGKKSKAL